MNAFTDDPVDELVREARSGSQDAFCGLVRRYQGSVRGYLGRYVRRADIVDDLAQEVFFIAFRNLEAWRGEAPIGVWLLGIARNHALAHLRREARRVAGESDRVESLLAVRRAEDAAADETKLETRERELEALSRCVGTLPGMSAAMLVHHYDQHLSAAEMARRLGRKESGVRMTLLRIRQALRKCVEFRLKAEGAQA